MLGRQLNCRPNIEARTLLSGVVLWCGSFSENGNLGQEQMDSISSARFLVYNPDPFYFIKVHSTPWPTISPP
jgi:hypothetical protein